MRTRALAGMLLGFCFASDASAERLTRPITDVTTLAREHGYELAFRWDPAIAEGPVAIRQALLRFELQGTPVERTRTLRVYPITSEWSPGSPSVDYDPELWSHVEFDFRGSGTVVADLTTLVREIAEQRMVSYGFLLTKDPADESGLSDSETARLAGLGSAQLEVTWRHVPRPPKGERGR